MFGRHNCAREFEIFAQNILLFTRSSIEGSHAYMSGEVDDKNKPARNTVIRNDVIIRQNVHIHVKPEFCGRLAGSKYSLTSNNTIAVSLDNISCVCRKRVDIYALRRPPNT